MGKGGRGTGRESLPAPLTAALCCRLNHGIRQAVGRLRLQGLLRFHDAADGLRRVPVRRPRLPTPPAPPGTEGRDRLRELTRPRVSRLGSQGLRRPGEGMEPNKSPVKTPEVRCWVVCAPKSAKRFPFHLRKSAAQGQHLSLASGSSPPAQNHRKGAYGLLDFIFSR